MAGIQRIVTLDDADKKVLGLDPNKVKGRVTVLLNEHTKAAKTALDKLRNADAVTPVDVAAAKQALELVEFWLGVFPDGFDLGDAADAKAEIAAARQLLADVDKLLADRT